MPALFYILGFLSLAFGGFALGVIHSDIQIGVATTALIGGFLLIGMGRCISLLEGIGREPPIELQRRA